MSKHALGMIEVKGLLGSIIAADTALKTADVYIINKSTIRGGLTSVQLFGDVEAITEAIQAARESVSNMNCYMSSTIIANLAPQVEEMIRKELAEHTNKIEKQTNENARVLIKEGKIPKDIDVKEIYHQFLRKIDREDSEHLENLRVTELRSLAYALELETMTKKEIKFANKRTLVDKLREKGVD